MAINVQKIDELIQQIADELSVDLTLYGNASPTKLFIESLKAGVTALQDTMVLLNNEQNPFTATHIKSKLGLAAIQSLNPTDLLTASSGMVTIDNKGIPILVNQYAKLQSEDGYDYYVVLPSETLLITKPTEVLIKQGVRKSLTFTLTGERWQTLTLEASDYVDTDSIEAYLNNNRLRIGKKLDEDCDCFVSMNQNGQTEIILDKNLVFIEGDVIQVDYAECIGIYGDNITVNEYMSGKGFAYSQEKDVSKDIEIYISMPIIGGVDFQTLTEDLAQEIRFAGKNNLIGTEEQMLNYVRRFKQYMIQTSKITDGVLELTCYRNVERLIESKDYWTAIQNIALTEADIRSLVYHLNYLTNKSLDLLVNANSAVISYCKVIATIEGDDIDPDVIALAISEYATEETNTRTFEIGKLYKAILNKYDISALHVVYELLDNNSTIDKFGTVSPNNIDTITVIGQAEITVNGVTFRYGQN